MRAAGYGVRSPKLGASLVAGPAFRFYRVVSEHGFKAIIHNILRNNRPGMCHFVQDSESEKSLKQKTYGFLTS